MVGMTEIIELHNAIAAVCPIEGVSDDILDPDTWEIQFADAATQNQRNAAYDKLEELKDEQS